MVKTNLLWYEKGFVGSYGLALDKGKTEKISLRLGETAIRSTVIDESCVQFQSVPAASVEVKGAGKG